MKLRLQAGFRTLKSIVRFLYWRRSFRSLCKQMGMTHYHATLAPGVDAKSFEGRANIYRDLHKMMSCCETAEPYYETNTDSTSR